MSITTHIPERVRRHWAGLWLALASIIALLLDLTAAAIVTAVAAVAVTWIAMHRRARQQQDLQESRQLRRDSSTAEEQDLGARVARNAEDYYGGRGLPLGRHIPPEGSVGQRVIADGETSVMVVGPPGSGKTTRVLAPAILTAPGPVLATSVKSDLAQMTTAPRALIGRVCVIDPAGVSTAVARTTSAQEHGKSSASRARAVSGCRTAWTPLQAARTAEAAEVTAHLLVTASAEVVQEGGGNRFWDNSAESLLTVLLWLATRVPGSSMRTVGELLAAVQRVADTSPGPEVALFGAPDDPPPAPPSSLELPDTPDGLVNLVRTQAGGGWRTVAAVLQGLAERYAEDDARAQWDVDTMRGVFETIAGVAQAAGETAAGIVGNLHTVLKPLLASPAIAGVAWDDPSALDLSAWAQSRSDTLHLIAPIRASVYRGYFSALVTAAVTEILDHAGRCPGQRLPESALIVLDELASVASLPGLTEWLATARSYRVRLALGIQSPAQLRRRYTRDGWYEIISSCAGGVIVLPGLADVEGLRDFQTLAGQRNLREVTTSTAETKGSSTSTGEQRSKSTSRSTTVTKTESIQRQDLASPAALREQPSDQAFVLVGAVAPLQIQTSGVWEDDVLAPLAYASGPALEAAVGRLQQLRAAAPPAR